MIDKSARQHYAMQGKIKNYLGKQKMVKAPKKWKSGPDHPDTELAYITKAEKDLILKADLHNSLSKGPNKGPSGIISLNSAGSGYGGPGPGRSSGNGGGNGPGPDRHPPAPVIRAPIKRDVVPIKAPIRRDVIPTFVEPPKDIRGDTPEKLKEQIILDEIQKKKKEQFEEDWGFEDLKRQAPKTFAPPIKTYERGVPFTDELVETVTPPKYGPTYYQDRSKIGGETWGERAEAEIPRGGIMSAIGGGLKKIGKTIFGDNPFDIAMNILTFSGWKQAKYAKMLLNARKEGSISNKAWKKAKYIGNKLLDKKAAKKLVKDKDGIATQIAKGTGLESGAELLGLKDIEGQQAKLTKLALAQYRILQKKKAMEQYGGEKFTPTDQKFLDKLEKMDKEEKIYSKPILTAVGAEGGRIDKPLTGRSRDI